MISDLVRCHGVRRSHSQLKYALWQVPCFDILSTVALIEVGEQFFHICGMEIALKLAEAIHTA